MLCNPYIVGPVFGGPCTCQFFLPIITCLALPPEAITALWVISMESGCYRWFGMYALVICNKHPGSTVQGHVDQPTGNVNKAICVPEPNTTRSELRA
jgi:hypothetical protein